MSFILNREKSVIKERLIFKKNWEYLLELIFEIIIYSIWIIMSILIISNPKNHLNISTTIIIIFANLILLTSWFYIYKLLKIEITNTENDRKLLVEILKEKFQEFTINDNGSNMLRCKKNVGIFSWGKTLIVLFEDTKILINMTTLGRYETKSPIHSLINYWKLKNIRKEFNMRKNGS